jgi:hypothetical protein
MWVKFHFEVVVCLSWLLWTTSCGGVLNHVLKKASEGAPLITLFLPVNCTFRKSGLPKLPFQETYRLFPE